MLYFVISSKRISESMVFSDIKRKLCIEICGFVLKGHPTWSRNFDLYDVATLLSEFLTPDPQPFQLYCRIFLLFLLKKTPSSPN